MRYTVLVAKPVRRFLERLADASQRTRFERVIEGLAVNPRPLGCQSLHGMRGACRVRVGGFRVLYQIEDTRLLVPVTEIGSRGQVYR